MQAQDLLQSWFLLFLKEMSVPYYWRLQHFHPPLSIQYDNMPYLQLIYLSRLKHPAKLQSCFHKQMYHCHCLRNTALHFQPYFHSKSHCSFYRQHRKSHGYFYFPHFPMLYPLQTSRRLPLWHCTIIPLFHMQPVPLILPVIGWHFFVRLPYLQCFAYRQPLFPFSWHLRFHQSCPVNPMM